MLSILQALKTEPQSCYLEKTAKQALPAGLFDSAKDAFLSSLTWW